MHEERFDEVLFAFILRANEPFPSLRDTVGRGSSFSAR